MTSLTLYKAAEDLAPLLEGGIDPDTGEMSPELGAALAKFEGKGQAVAAFILNQEATADAIDEAIKKLEVRSAAYRKRADSLKGYMKAAMKRTGVTSITADDGTFSVKLHIERDESVDVFEPELLPADFLRTPPPPKAAPDKTKIKAALKAGTDVPGARIVKSDRLEVK